MQNKVIDRNRISLCLTYPRLSDPDKSTKFRVADLVDGELIPVNFFSGDIETKLIFSRQQDAVNYRAELVEWWYDEDDLQRTKSVVYEKNNIFELVNNRVFLDKWAGSLEAFLVDLKNGFRVPEGLTDRFILVIDEDDLYYMVVLLESKNIVNGMHRISINGDKLDTLKSTIEVYKLNKKDVIDTNLSNIKDANDEYVRRLFYKKCVLPNPEKVLPVFSVVDFLPYLLKRYIRNSKNKFHLTNNNVKEISYFINEFSNDLEEIQALSEYLSLSEKEVKKELVDFRDKIVNFIRGDECFDYVIENILMTHEDVAIDLKEKVKIKWMTDADEDRNSLYEDINQRKIELEEINREIDSAKAKLDSIKCKIVDNNIQLEKLNKLLNSTRDEINKLLVSYKHDLLRVFGDHELSKFLNTNKLSEDCDVAEDILIITPQHDNLESMVTDDIEYLIEDFSNNLKTIGTIGKWADDISKYIISLLILSMPVVLPHNVAQNIANALSVLLENTDTVEIRMPTKKVVGMNIKKLIEDISHKVIYINNFIEDMEDEVLSQIGGVKNKLIVISYKDDYSLQLMSKYVFDKFTFINYDDYIGVPNGENLLKSKVPFNILNSYTSNKLNIEKCFIDIKNTYVNQKINNSILLKHARVLDIYKQIGGRKESNIAFSELNFISNSNITQMIKGIDSESPIQVGEL